jgi:drug/metabolite transporter (DMT)-like permease
VRDGIIYAGLILGFATLVTVHVALAGRMFLRQRPRWRGLVALVVPPLGVIWALRAGWKKLGLTWIGALVVYVVALIAARA